MLTRVQRVFLGLKETVFWNVLNINARNSKNVNTHSYSEMVVWQNRAFCLPRSL